MTMTDLYHSCIRLSWVEVHAELDTLDTLPGPAVLATYTALGLVSRRPVAAMRQAIRRAVLDRKGAYERVSM